MNHVCLFTTAFLVFYFNRWTTQYISTCNMYILNKTLKLAYFLSSLSLCLLKDLLQQWLLELKYFGCMAAVFDRVFKFWYKLFIFIQKIKKWALSERKLNYLSIHVIFIHQHLPLKYFMGKKQQILKIFWQKKINFKLQTLFSNLCNYLKFVYTRSFL